MERVEVVGMSEAHDETKYDLEWWKTFHTAVRALGQLDALEAFDALTAEVLADSDDLDPLHTAIMWFNHAKEEDKV